MSSKLTFEQAKAIFDQPFNDLLFQAHTIYRQNFDPNKIQASMLLNFKTGGCPENCSYCPQSAHYDTPVKKETLTNLDDAVKAAKSAKESGATRFCMGAAWRGPTDKDLDYTIEMIKQVKELGMETCATLGLLKEGQAEKLKEAGLDFYNHNLDTSRDYYDKIITTRTYDDRLQTLSYVADAGLQTCCGGILGMGETNDDRIQMLLEMAALSKPPKSVPINQLIRIPGTPLEQNKILEPFDLVRIIALARIMFPQSYVRLTAGRTEMTDELQALCFFAGANSIFIGEKLLTTENPSLEKDQLLMQQLGLEFYKEKPVQVENV